MAALTVEHLRGADVEAGDEALRPPVRPHHPAPVGVVLVQQCHHLAALHADLVLVAGRERVEDDEAANGVLEEDLLLSQLLLLLGLPQNVNS